jgi:NitT/TauT family transport system substrate-binding protein
MASADKNTTLRMALLPIPDVLPVYVAEANGYFKELGITVEPLPVGSPVERDQLLQAGSIDGMINEISGAAIFNREKIQAQIVSIARAPINTSPLFRILAAPGSGIKEISDLAGVPVGISKNTIIEYISTRMLTQGGISADKIKYKSVPVLPERFQLLLSGQLKAVTLPDPLGAAAIKAGAIEVVNDLSAQEFSASVITFSTRTLQDKKAAVEAFMIAWDRAAADLNSDPEAYRSLMLKKIRVPKNIQKDFNIPPMARKSLPTKAQWDDVMDWMVAKKLLVTPVSYDETVTSEFLSK